MNSSLYSKRNLVFALMLAVAALLAGCAGSGGGSGSSVQAQVQNGTFDGTLSDGTGPVQNLTLKLVKNGSTETGAAVFTDLGTGRGAGFQLNFGGVVQNLVWGPGPAAVSFDITQFSTLAPYLTLHFTGTYAPSSTGATLTGTVTGSKKGGGSVNLSFAASFSPTQTVMDFGGYWVGNVTVSGVPVPYTATLAVDADKVKITGTVTAAGSTVPFTTGVRAGQTFFGEFAGDALGVPGTTGVWYVTASDATHFSGTYILMNSSSVIVGSGTITGVKTTPPPPSGFPLALATVYNGTLTQSGSSSSSFRIEIDQVGTTAGENHGAYIVDPTTGNSSAGNFESVTSNGSTVTLVASDLNQAYTAVTFTGTASGGTAAPYLQYTGTYTAALVGGGTQTGTFTLVRSTIERKSLNGVYTGSILLTGTSTTRAWAGNFLQPSGGTSFAATVDHGTALGGLEYSVYGYVVGDQFVAEGDTLTQPSGTVSAHYEGFISNGNLHLDASTHYAGTAFSSSFNEQGNLTANHS